MDQDQQDKKGCSERNFFDSVCMKLPCKPEYVGVVRLTVSAIANRMGFNIEEIEDIKVAVAEACTNAIKHGNDLDFMANFDIFNDKMTISIRDNGDGIQGAIVEPDLLNPSEEGGLGIFIIKSLMDDVNLTSSQGSGTEITMTKFLEEEL